MASKEVNVNVSDQLRVLIELQRKELDAARVDAERATLPAQKEALQANVAVVKAEIAVAEARLEESAADRKLLERQVEDQEAKAEKYREQELLVRTNEQLWALQKEIQQARDAISGFEEKILEHMEGSEALNTELASRRQRLAEVETLVASQVREIDARAAALAQEREQLSAEIGDAERQADHDLLRLYGRVKNIRRGVGVAEALEETCLGCNTRIRPQLYVDVMNMERIVQCDSCKRLLFSRKALQLPSSVEIEQPA